MQDTVTSVPALFKPAPELQTVAKDFPAQVREWHAQNKSTYAKTARHFDITLIRARDYCAPIEIDTPLIAAARVEFERLFSKRERNQMGMRRSLKGVYVNPSLARDWRMFKAGVEYHHQLKEAS